LNENLDVLFIALLFIVIIIGMFILFRKMNFNIKYKYFNKTSKLNELEKEIEQLEDASKGLISELEDVKGLEKEIKEKIKNIEN
jgi:uncharacterized protein YoxC